MINNAEVVPPIFRTELAAFVHVAFVPPHVISFCIFTVALLVIVVLLAILITGAIVRLVPIGMVLLTPSVIAPLPVILPVPFTIVPAAPELVTLDVPRASVPSVVKFPLTVKPTPPVI